MGVSRSFAQRRAKFLDAQSVRSVCTRDREDAGAAPLPAGHPITWTAIAFLDQGNFSGGSAMRM